MAAAAGRRDETAGSAASWALRHILGLVARGGLGPGQQLPAERDLSLQLGVSRSSIREALSALVALGVLDSRHGAGVFVTSLDPEHLFGGLRLVLEVVDADRRSELFDVQGTLRAAAGGLAAIRRTDADGARLRELADACREATTAGLAALADRRFHAEICRLGGNQTLSALADAMVPGDALDGVWRRWWAKDHEAVHDEHDAMVRAIERGDAEASRALAVAHTFRTQLTLGTDLPAADPPVTVHGSAALTETAEPGGGAVASRPTPAWYRDAKFGVIVHWGLYSVPGWAPLDDSLVELLTDAETSPHGDEPDPLFRHPFAEWYQNSVMLEGSPTWHYHRATYGDRGYADFRKPFEAALRDWDPSGWAELFAAAGARYVVQVAKHHDGYLLWPSKNPNPHNRQWRAPRDIVGEVGAAIRASGLRLGLFYSSGLDWTFAHLPIRRMVDSANSIPDGPEYARYVEAHWRELINRYQPSMLWNDMGYPASADAEALFREYYQRVPDGLVTDRFGASTFDVATPNYSRRHAIDPRVWEGVRPVGLSFGWNRQEDERHTLTGAQLVHLLVDFVSKNGNLLLGVSPDEHGRIPELQERGLRELGAWLARHGEAVYGSRPWTSAESSTHDGVSVRFTVGGHAEPGDQAGGGDLFVFLLGQPAGELVVTGLHLPPEAVVTELGRSTPLEVRPGRRGSVIVAPPAAAPTATRVLRVSPAPPGLET